MSNRFTDALFQLIRSLEKSEKRHFKLYIRRSSSKEDLKIIQLFDALDKMHDYDEKALLKKLAPITKPQLSNLKGTLIQASACESTPPENIGQHRPAIK
jgi:hypothetical protein